MTLPPLATGHPSPLTRRRLLGIIGLAPVATAGTLALEQRLWPLNPSPTVTLLGAGTSLSALVTAGPARLLIASGDDPRAFDEALQGQLAPAVQRIDIALMTGQGTALRVPAHLERQRHPRATWTIGVDRAAAEPDVAAALIRAAELPCPRRFVLPAGLSVTVESAANPDGSVAGWRTQVRHGASVLTICSEAGAASLFDWSDPAPVIAVVHGPASPLVGQVACAALFFVASSTAAANVRAAVKANPTGAPRWGGQITSSGAATITFGAGGLHLPADISPLTPG